MSTAEGTSSSLFPTNPLLTSATSAAANVVSDMPVSAAQTSVDNASAAAAVAAAAAAAAAAASTSAPVSTVTSSSALAVEPKPAIVSDAIPTPAIAVPPHVGAPTPDGVAAAAAAVAHPSHPPQMPMAATAFGQYPTSVVFAPADPSVIEDQPTYVNPKQYARILKRRESRKKQTGTDVTSYTPRKRSYMHESRHKHAMQRRRGPGGRFLSKEERENQVKETSAAAQ